MSTSYRKISKVSSSLKLSDVEINIFQDYRSLRSISTDTLSNAITRDIVNTLAEWSLAKISLTVLWTQEIPPSTEAHAIKRFKAPAPRNLPHRVRPADFICIVRCNRVRHSLVIFCHVGVILRLRKRLAPRSCRESNRAHRRITGFQLSSRTAKQSVSIMQSIRSYNRI